MIQARSPRILVADDDAGWRETLVDLFEPSGWQTLLASGGIEVLEIIQHEPVDCLLIDMHMPDMSGLETVRLVRLTHRLLPCVMVTADPNGTLVQSAFDLHILEVLTKPVPRDVLTRSISHALATSA